VRTRDPKKELSLRKKAMAMVVKEGFAGFSMQKLAKSAGVSPATIYIYWKDKDDLLLQLYTEAFGKMGGTTLGDFDPGMSFQEGLRIQWKNRARWCLEHPVEAAFIDQVRFSPLHDRAHRCIAPSFADTMKSFVKGAIARGELVKIPVEVYWSVAFAPLYQLIKFHQHGKGLPGTGPFALDEKTLNLTLDLVLKALKP
jgi:TetR/AcrR family transcriptional regulator, multidrug resistance operon repressor